MSEKCHFRTRATQQKVRLHPQLVRGIDRLYGINSSSAQRRKPRDAHELGYRRDGSSHCLDCFRTRVGVKHDSAVTAVAGRPLEKGRRFLRNDLMESGG